MSHSVLRTERFKSPSDIKGVQKHVQRETEKYANQDIKKESSHLNYDFINSKNIDFNEKAKKRIEEGYTGKRKVRSDAIKLIDGLITSDNKFFKKMEPLEIKDFFEHSLEFLKEEFGEENIMYATVHLDEKTPHMHYGFVPLTDDGRLSAKDVIGGKGKMSFRQDKFNKYMNSKGYELKRGESAFVSKRKHIETSEYKNKTEYHKNELAIVKNDLTREFERLDKLSSISPEISTKRLESKKKDIPEPEPVEANAFRVVNTNKLANLNDLAMRLHDLAYLSQKELEEKDNQIDELADLNKKMAKKLEDEFQEQAIREREIADEEKSYWVTKHTELEYMYQKLTHNIDSEVTRLRSDDVEKLAQSRNDLKEKNTELTTTNRDLSDRVDYLIAENNNLKTKNDELKVEINTIAERFETKLEAMQDKFDQLKDDFRLSVGSMYYATRDFIKNVAEDSFERVFNRFRVDYDDELHEYAEFNEIEKIENEFEHYVLHDDDPNVVFIEKDLENVKKSVRRQEINKRRNNEMER